MQFPPCNLSPYIVNPAIEPLVAVIFPLIVRLPLPSKPKTVAPDLFFMVIVLAVRSIKNRPSFDRSMPAVIRAVTYIIPARYFVSTLQSLFLAGNIPVVLVVNVLFLIASAVMFIGLTWLKTKRRLD